MSTALLLAGCSLSADLHVAADGSGDGRVELHDAPGTAAELVRQAEGFGFLVRHVEAWPDRRVAMDLAWRNFAPPFQARQVETDGAVTLVFGDVTDLVLTVTVPGRILPGECTGQVLADGSLRFDHGRARLTYVPAGCPWPVLVGGPALLLAALLFAVSRRRPGPGRSAS